MLVLTMNIMRYFKIKYNENIIIYAFSNFFVLPYM